MFEGYLGQALTVARVAAGLTQAEVLAEFNKRTGLNLSLARIDNMEKDIEEISVGIFNVWCGLLPWGKVKVLKCAYLLRQNTHCPANELLEEALDEVEYRLWKSHLDNQ